MEILKIRKILSVLGILFIVGAIYLNLLGILEANSLNQVDVVLGYIVSANIINGLAVICLIILTVNSSKLDIKHKIILVLVLLIGIIGEYYLFATQLYSKNYTSYIVLIINLLLRVYYLTYYYTESWAMFPGWYLTYVKELEKAVIPSEVEKVFSPQSEKSTKTVDADVQAFKDRWNAIVSQAKEKAGDDWDEATRNRAYNKFLVPAIAEKQFTTEKLREAATLLKDKSGNTITDLTIGGRRRR